VDAEADQPIRNGACLALGLAAMGTGDAAVYRSLRDVLLADVTVSSEAAGLAMGLLLLGRGTEWRSMEFHDSSTTGVCDELLNYARDSAKEKIARSVALGLALVVLGQEEGAEALVGEMAGDKDSVIRYGAQYALGLAYAGTGNSGALRRLLHTAVSDVSDDVRRAAVTAIGFILARTPGAVPGVVGQLAESYNPHVRYGAALAIGVSCAGSGLAEALALLEPLLEDSVDFVKSGALIAMGLVLQGENAVHFPRVAEVRERLNKIIAGKLDGALTKMGAVLALGLMSAGGQNCTAGIL
jgi:26S proteasome regulatory subunit N2